MVTENIKNTIKKNFPVALVGLAYEAYKCNTFEEFKHDFLHEIKHGVYWHVTADPNFKVDPEKGSRDTTTMAANDKPLIGSLMFTSDLSYWSTDYTDRNFVALLDLSDVDRGDYKQVNRGMGNEFFIRDARKVRVVEVMPKSKALSMNYRYHKVLENTIWNDDELLKFFNKVKDLTGGMINESEEVVDTQNAMSGITSKVTDKTQDLEYWRQRALHDPLTGLPNRLAADMIVKSMKEDIQYLVVIDIDHFKNINDTYGHDAGDKVLSQLAKFLDDRLIVTRFGGEEFVCYLAGEAFSTQEDTDNYLNQLREDIGKISFDGVGEYITVSMGVTIFDRGRNVEDLFKLADKALYCAKEWGRNMVVFYEDGMDCEAHLDDDGELSKNELCELGLE